MWKNLDYPKLNTCILLHEWLNKYFLVVTKITTAPNRDLNKNSLFYIECDKLN